MNEWFHHKSSFSSHIPSKNAFETGSFVDEKSLKYIEKKKKINETPKISPLHVGER